MPDGGGALATYGITLTPAQRRVLAEASRGNGMLHCARPNAPAGRGVKARWNVATALESLDLCKMVRAEERGVLYEWELTCRGYEVGRTLPLPAADAA